MILKSYQHNTVIGERGRAWGGGGGEGGVGVLLPPVPCNPGSRPLFSWLFSITKYWPLLRNFPHLSLFSCRSLLSRLPYPSRPFFPRTSTNTWMDCGLSIFSLAEGKGGRDVWGKWRRGPNLPLPTPCIPASLPFYLDFLPLGLLRLRNIAHYIVA